MPKTANVFARVEPEIKEEKFPARRPPVMSELTKEELDAELAKGVASIESGRVCSAKEVFEELCRSF